jgi:hypothetical protein
MKTGAIIGLLVAGIAAVAVSLPVLVRLTPMHRQMEVGRKYMDSMTEKDFQRFIELSKPYLTAFDPKADPIGARSVPADLASQKVIRIDVFSNAVLFVWMGGLDHTYIEVRRADSGEFVIDARYNDKVQKQLWPKIK